MKFKEFISEAKRPDEGKYAILKRAVKATGTSLNNPKELDDSDINDAIEEAVRLWNAADNRWSATYMTSKEPHSHAANHLKSALLDAGKEGAHPHVKRYAEAVAALAGMKKEAEFIAFVNHVAGKLASINDAAGGGHVRGDVDEDEARFTCKLAMKGLGAKVKKM